MIEGRLDLAQIASNGAALTLTVALFAALLAARADRWRTASQAALNTPMPGIEIALQQDQPVAPPAPSAPRPSPSHPPPSRVAPRPRFVAATPESVPAEAAPLDPAPVPDGGALVSTPSMPTAAEPPGDAHADLENRYAAALRADIDRRTHSPDTAQYRLHRPSGEARVAFLVTRTGEPKAVRIIHTSGSAILDEAAVGIVSAGRYPPMSDNVFVGESEHAFAVTIEFRAT